ncbi:MAG: DUF2344 domain-containing protein [Pseudonocardiaceae bacterium]|nr:DUF2344 domain-containing protein [Pseudonocardiaceae bacterium]
MNRKDQPNPSRSPVAKLRLRYAKRGKLRFTSHRDIARAFERAVRKAHIPVAYSQGFSPHPKISWVGAAPTGVASEAEYVEIQVVERLRPERILEQLNDALPEGLDVREAVVAAGGSLPARIDASSWRLAVSGVAGAELSRAVAALLAVDHVEVDRMTKNGMRKLDVRPALVSAQVEAVREHSSEPTEPEETTVGEPYGILTLVVRQMTPTVRPDDVLSALGVVAGLVPPAPVTATRMAQGRLDDAGGLVDPLLEDRAAVPDGTAEERKPARNVVE